MSEFNANDYQHNAGGNEKILTPGEHYCRILNVKLDAPSFKPEAYFVTLLLEGPAMGDDFEGIAIDKDNESAGKYAGKIATVNAMRYPFSDFEWKGKEISRDEQIFNWINGLATQLDVLKDIQKAGIKANTIEEYVEAVKPFLTQSELWAHFTIAGREYYKDGYDKPNYNLFFPKRKGKDYPFSAITNEKEQPLNYLNFNEEEHIIKTDKPGTATDVDGFEGQSEENDSPTLD